MKVFDFDNTIYRGESSVDFAFFMIKHHKKIMLYVPKILFSLAGYKLCLISKPKLEAIVNEFLEFVMDGTVRFEDFVEPFWATHSHKLNRKILKRIKPDDIIISEVDFDIKRVTWFNFGDNKVIRFRELYGDRSIDVFYTDSFNDKDMMKISKEVYIVKKGKIVRHLRRRRRKDL